MTIHKADDDAVREAAKLLSHAKLVAFPTETVYGLGANATHAGAVADIFAAKGRPQFNPLIIHVADLAIAQKYGIFSNAALALAHAFWPGPLTLVVPLQTANAATPPIADLVTAGLETLAIRVPAHPTARALLSACGFPLAAPSANISGHVSPTTAQHVENDLAENVAMILDAGPCEVGLESTIVDCSRGDEKIAILRSGAVTHEDIVQVAKCDVGAFVASDPQRPNSPGQLVSHYAPRTPIRLNAVGPRKGEALLSFGPGTPDTGNTPAKAVFNLSPTGNLKEAATQLFAALRHLDDSGSTAIAVMPIPNEGLGVAVNDRLSRAAGPRPTQQNKPD